MLKIILTLPYKSLPKDLTIEVPNFTVLTGENGSGKSQLFEAMSSNGICNIAIDEQIIPSNQIQYVRFGTLIPRVDNQFSPSIISQKITGTTQALQQAITRVESQNQNTHSNTQDFSLKVLNQLKGEYRAIIQNISTKENVLIHNVTTQMIAKYVSSQSIETPTDLLTSKFSELFKRYQLAKLENQLNKLQQQDGVEGLEVLSDEEFIEKNGEQPWIFVNDILNKLGLPFRAATPEKDHRDALFQFNLIHIEDDLTIQLNQLSTGEQVLLSLALASYVNSQHTNTKLLIIDEPDAPLHPSMSKLMLELLEEEIVKKRKINVIISTHSPATIACTPVRSLQKIDPKTKLITQCTAGEASALLSVGIPNFKVTTEGRRQVFVEFEYDVEYLSRIFDSLKRIYDYQIHPYFLPPHNREGSNCDDVKKITKTLRDMGNTQVYGLIDWDKKNKPEEQLIILGMGHRYAIENYIFEPYYLGLYLLRKNYITANELGLDEHLTYRDVTKLIDTNSIVTLQLITDTIESKLWGVITDKTIVTLANRETLKLSSQMFTKQGHAYEEKCKNIWPKLKGVRTNNMGDSYLKLDIIETVIRDFPEYLSIDLVDTFKKIS